MTAALLASVALSFMPLAASAQVPSATLPPFQPKTYSASFSALSLPQTGAMDAACLVGSATRTVKVIRVAVNGVNTTAQSSVVNLVKRTAASTGGTSTNATAVNLDSLDAAATATFTGYTVANTPGAGVAMRAAAIGFGPATAAATLPLVWDFNAQLLQKPLVLRGVAQAACVNFPNAFTTSGTLLDVDVTWTEL